MRRRRSHKPILGVFWLPQPEAERKTPCPSGVGVLATITGRDRWLRAIRRDQRKKSTAIRPTRSGTCGSGGTLSIDSCWTGSKQDSRGTEVRLSYRRPRLLSTKENGSRACDEALLLLTVLQQCRHRNTAYKNHAHKRSTTTLIQPIQCFLGRTHPPKVFR